MFSGTIPSYYKHFQSATTQSCVWNPTNMSNLSSRVEKVIKHNLQNSRQNNYHSYPSTHYSINSLFSEFFRKFGGVFLEVCETISGCIWEVFGGKIKENYTETIQKQKSQNSH